MLICLAVILVACDAAPASPPTPAAPLATPTTIFVVITVPPIPTSSPTPIVPVSSPGVVTDRIGALTSDGTAIPPPFTLAGGDYLFSWMVAQPTTDRGCTFAALLTPGPSVSPSTVQTLGPLTILPDSRLTGSKQVVGLGAGDYTLRPSGDGRWSVTVTPLRGR